MKNLRRDCSKSIQLLKRIIYLRWTKTQIILRNLAKIIQKSVVEIEKRFNSKVVTLLWKFEKFYQAEDYHQDYYQKNFLKYLAYKKACQREEVLRKIWN